MSAPPRRAERDERLALSPAFLPFVNIRAISRLHQEQAGFFCVMQNRKSGVIVAVRSAEEISPKIHIPARRRATPVLADRLENIVQMVSRWAGVTALIATLAAIGWVIL
ncbi:hypothetical protein [Sphingobium sp. TCM1]|uniref:hypothetical protein n=1 Tax=Sphingobium sp. TCM1 TaxID=453246 RepID=UPI0012ECE191|nr:hypothetical protein [Sphingobium sp. TCM1]